MLDATPLETIDSFANTSSITLDPPQGNPESAEKYIQELVKLLDQDKVLVNHTDLKKFDIASISDHYRIDLIDHEVEVTHSKQPETGKDFYIILFNNIKKIRDGNNQQNTCVNKIILAYIHLSDHQFHTFKLAADDQIGRRHRKEEEIRFQQAMTPIDDALNLINNTAIDQKE